MTETPLPSNVGTGTVTATLVTAQKATSTGNEVQVAATGKVIFTPNVKPGQPLLNCNATPKLMIVPQPVNVDVQADGSVSMVLISNQDPDLNPTGWNWTASFQLGGGMKLNPITFDLPIGSTVDLADVAQVVPQAGTMILRGAGVPAGGTTGQVLTKASDTDDDTEWATPAVGTGGTGGAVDSVNGKTGTVVLAASDVGALPSSYVPAWSQVTGKPTFATVATTGAYADLSGKPTLGTAASAATTDFDPAGAAAAVTVSSIGAATAAQGAKADTAVQPSGLTKAAVGLGNVDNTSDLAKPISTATQTVLDGKANTADVPGDLSQLSGKVGVTQVIPGGVLSVGFTSANYQSLARPTSRTDVRVIWVGDSTTSSTTMPANRIAGDLTFTTQS